MFCEASCAVLIRRIVGSIALTCILFTVACSGAGARQQPAVVLVPTSLAISPSTANQPAGRTQQFTAIATFSDSSTRDVTAEAFWSSSATSIATVDQRRGIGTALARGDVTISASFSAGANTVTAAAMLQVTAPVAESISIAPVDPRLDLGANQQFIATLTLSDRTTVDVTQSASWSSSNESVLRVNNTTGRSGLANTRGPGAATVRASFNGVTSSTLSTVTRRTPKFLFAAGIAGIEGFSIDPGSGALTPVG